LAETTSKYIQRSRSFEAETAVMWRLVTKSLASHGQPLLKYDECPEYLKSNPYIRTGYRSAQSLPQCLRSVFSFHNETLNIWTHLLGFVFFLSILLWDFWAPPIPSRITWQDFAVILIIIGCYQICMIMSAVFHTFTSHSQDAHELCLQMDLAGIGASITASFLCGIYYAFWCYPLLCAFYMSTVLAFIICGAAFMNKMNKEENIVLRLIYFCSFTIYGFVPTLHWVWINGFYSDEVKIFLPRIFIFYLFCGAAFMFYIAKFPESCLPGKFDIFGSSHQWWHAFIWAGLAYWHHTGYIFAEYRLETGCGGVSPDDHLLDRYYSKFWITL